MPRDISISSSAPPASAEPTSTRWSKPPPASTSGANGPASKLGARMALTSSLRCAKTPRESFFHWHGRNPDTSGFNDPEVFLRIIKHHHAGLILRSTDPQRLQSLLDCYAQRFAQEFLAVEPQREKPTRSEVCQLKSEKNFGAVS